MYSKEIFIFRLNELRGSLSVYAFAKKCSIPQPIMDRYCKGQSVPSIDKCTLICVTCNVSADWLLCLSDEKHPARAAGSVSVSGVVSGAVGNGNIVGAPAPGDLAERLAALEKTVAELPKQTPPPAKTNKPAAKTTRRPRVKIIN